MPKLPERIIGMRIALRPIFQNTRGTTRLGREIAAKTFDVPAWDYIQSLETRWKGISVRTGQLDLAYGPDFDFTP